MSKRYLTAKVSIDVGEKTVRVIKTNIRGKITRSSTVELPIGMPNLPDPKYAAALTAAIKKAAKGARAARGSNTMMVVGGPHIIVRAFTWPEMSADALAANAEFEIAPYLPDELSLFSVHYTVLKRSTTTTPDSKNPVVQLEVLVAAIMKNVSDAYMLGARKAGFKPIRLDIRENARGKLMHSPQAWHGAHGSMPFDPDKSFVVLDIADTLINMTVFINGTYYANRYFSLRTSGGMPDGLGNESAESTFGSADNDSAAPKSSGDESRPDVDADQLATEVSSIIDYIHYRERGSHVECILLIGKASNVPNILQSLADNLEIPVLQPAEDIIKQILSGKQRQNGAMVNDYLDAYGALLPAPKKLSPDINIKFRKKNRHIFKRIVLPITLVLIIWGAVIAAGIYFPYTKLQGLKAKEAELDKELLSYTVSETDITQVTEQINVLTQTTLEATNFYFGYPQAARVVAHVVDILPRGSRVQKMQIENGAVTVSCVSNSLEDASDIIVSLRKNVLFRSIHAKISTSTGIDGVVSVTTDITFGIRTVVEVITE